MDSSRRRNSSLIIIFESALLGVSLWTSGCAGGDDAIPKGSGGSAVSGGGGGWPSGGAPSGGVSSGGVSSGGVSSGGVSSGGVSSGGSGNFVPSCPASCAPIPGAPNPYPSLTTPGGPKTLDPENHGDVNPKLRGWAACTEVGCGSTGNTLGLVQIDGPTDTGAPKLHTLFQPPEVRTIAANYRGYDWDWSCNCKGALIQDGDVQWVAFQTAKDEPIYVPKSGYEIAPGLEVRALLVDGDTVTLKYTIEDDVVYGYTLHIVGICPEPGLRAKYDSDQSAGRTELPALAESGPIGRACGSTTLVTIRDTGAFMDPRSEKDWWQGHP